MLVQKNRLVPGPDIELGELTNGQPDFQFKEVL